MNNSKEPIEKEVITKEENSKFIPKNILIKERLIKNNKKNLFITNWLYYKEEKILILSTIDQRINVLISLFSLYFILINRFLRLK